MFRSWIQLATRGPGSRATKAFALALPVVVALVLALGLALPRALPVSANPDTIVLASDTGTKCGGYTTTNPGADPLNVANYGGIWIPAVDITTTHGGPWWYDNSLIAPAVWVSSSSLFPREGTADEDQWRLFKEDFTIPAGHVVTSASVEFTADNAVEVYLVNSDNPTGVLVATTPDGPSGFEDLVYGPSPFNAFDPQYCQNLYMANFVPQEGANTLMFVVRNWAWPYENNITGLLYRAEIETEERVEPSESGVGGEIYFLNEKNGGFPTLWLSLALVLAVGGGMLVVKRRRAHKA